MSMENTSPQVAQDRAVSSTFPGNFLTNTAPSATPALAISLGTATAPNIYFGTGVPAISAPQGSLFIRTDGSSTSTRMYINTNGTTGWTNFTTAT